ncbi:hypothetical protein VMT65_37665 [Nocardia sp. CDC153]|uniref:hypothetical protein n=1 Tax=Nocardia sp. CDC153 TaxID=3112167 RepID=UPI002DB93DAE|nr:hypothetical protein [Nocardia sp. CDC153]MEC3958814.1 hypothetical protein [Nocardia sp. CDC153]
MDSVALVVVEVVTAVVLDVVVACVPLVPPPQPATASTASTEIVILAFRDKRSPLVAAGTGIGPIADSGCALAAVPVIDSRRRPGRADGGWAIGNH